MSVCSITASLPENRIAVVANGKEQVTEDVLKAIKVSRLVIAVDGGLNFCYKHQIAAQYLIGDLDSVDKMLIPKFQYLKVIQLDRTKDILDLEAGLQLAYKDRTATPCIFNALGGRRDHHRSNLYLLLKYSRAILVTNNTSVSKANVGAKIMQDQLDPYHRMLYAFYGDGCLNVDSKEIHLKKGCQLDIEGKRLIKVINGNMLLISRDNKSSYRFSNQDVLLLENMQFPCSDEYEDIFLLSPENLTVRLRTQVGLTISLIPWLDAVQGIRTKGLKWNLQDDEMHKTFIGISNIALSDHVTISVKKGSLLCIVEKHVIDREMVDLQDHSSTAKFIGGCINITGY